MKPETARWASAWRTAKPATRSPARAEQAAGPRAVEASRDVPVAVNLGDDLGRRALEPAGDLGGERLVRALGDHDVGPEGAELVRDPGRQGCVEARPVDRQSAAGARSGGPSRCRSRAPAGSSAPRGRPTCARGSGRAAAGRGRARRTARAGSSGRRDQDPLQPPVDTVGSVIGDRFDGVRPSGSRRAPDPGRTGRSPR